MNTVYLEGNLGKDIEISFTNAGMAVARGSVACNRRIKSGDEWKDVTDWVPFVAFDALAEGMNDWVKGMRVWITGRFQTTKYEKNGETRYSSNVVALGAGAAIAPFRKKGKEKQLKESTFNDMGTEVDENIPF